MCMSIMKCLGGWLFNLKSPADYEPSQYCFLLTSALEAWERRNVTIGCQSVCHSLVHCTESECTAGVLFNSAPKASRRLVFLVNLSWLFVAVNGDRAPMDWITALIGWWDNLQAMYWRCACSEKNLQSTKEDQFASSLSNYFLVFSPVTWWIFATGFDTD